MGGEGGKVLIIGMGINSNRFVSYVSKHHALFLVGGNIIVIRLKLMTVNQRLKPITKHGLV